ncbi:serine peptidase [Streptomyces sp. NPDC014684]|uniref:serine peptidase n=1 Tax=Streptomyces sp. NPDC014684 TaxID=3364880 RepID=UPI003701F6F3
MRIVAVHGVGNHLGVDISGSRLEELRALKAADWAQQLTSGLGIPAGWCDLDFAYYADKLSTGPATQGTPGDDFLDDPLAQEMLTAWATELGVPKEVSQGHATLPLRALSSWVARRFDLAEGPLRVFLRMLFPEVATYLRTQDAPERISAREEVAARIGRHRPSVLIAHSLGSVVAYEALHAHPELQPQLFLTLGSPLALPRAVFERLIPTPRSAHPNPRGQRLPGRTRWVNIADPGDPVAVPPRLGKYFDGIAHDHTDVISPGFRFHHAANYLQCPATAATIAPYINV